MQETECDRGLGEEWDADRGAREAPDGRGRAASLPASPGHMGPIIRVPYTAACSCPWPRCGSPCSPPGLHTSTRRLRLLQRFLQERGLLTIPCQPAQPQSLQLGGRAANPPPSTPPSPGPGKWVCGSRTDAGAFPGAVGCTLCQGGGLAGTPSQQGGTQVPCTPPVSAQAHAARALPTQLWTLPCTPLPACPSVSNPSYLPSDPEVPCPCPAPFSALPGWWHNAGCPEQGDRNSGWALTFLMLL